MIWRDRLQLRTFLLLVFFCSMVFGPRHGLAQAIDAEKFQKYLFSQPHQQFVAKALSSIPKTIFERCPGLVSKGSKSTPLKPISFSQDGFPNSGAWKQEFPVEGCGNDTVLNLYFVVGTDQKINVVLGVPGSTRADLRLQNDAVRYANIGAKSKASQCEHFDIKNSRFEGFGLPDQQLPDPGPNARFRQWWETWTLIGCGRTFDVPLEFSPHDGGTLITQSLGKVVER